MCLEMNPSWCRKVNWGNCGIPWVNCVVLCVKDDFWDLCYCLKYCAVYSVFPSGTTSQSKIVQYNWECIARLRCSARLTFCSLQRMTALSAWETGKHSTLVPVGEIRHYGAEQFTALQASHQQSDHPAHSGSQHTDPNTKTLRLN